MSEDVSSTIRTGVTVILVAALVSTVLSLMVISQSILTTGISTLQSGVDQVGLQEFETYNQKKVTGIQVRSALSLYEGRDIAICIQTKSTRETKSATTYINYGSLLDPAKNNKGTDAVTGDYYMISLDKSDTTVRKEGNSFWTVNLAMESGSTMQAGNLQGTQTTGNMQFLLESARFRAELVKDASGTIVGITFTQLN